MLPVPVIMISGFLGSGKTTLLRRLMAEARARTLRFGVLMNELGSKDVDGSILGPADEGYALEKLFDGCLCCDKKSDITRCLRQLLALQPDVLFIELTGVANPEEIADSLTEPGLRGLVELKRIITVLDAEFALEYSSLLSADRQLVHTLRRQMETADVLVINKAELASVAVMGKIKQLIFKHNPKADMIQTSYARIDPELVLSGIEPGAGKASLSEATAASPRPAPRLQIRGSRGAQAVRMEQPRTEKAVKTSYTRLQTLCLQMDSSLPLPRTKLETFIRQAGRQLLRAKGYLPTSNRPGSMELCQYAVGRFSWEPTAYADAPYLVLIGLGLDVDAVHRRWQELTQQRG